MLGSDNWDDNSDAFAAFCDSYPGQLQASAGDWGPVAGVGVGL